jgi:RNA 3'-terminal phosphate cyclase (ATP)
MKYLEIDASHGEGGGQVTRLAMALAAITGRAVHLKNIRAKRAKPGLMAQHLTALRAVAALSGGELAGDALGATQVHFLPGPIRGGEYSFQVGTAGSVALVLQAVLPVALRADGPCRLQIGGGTDVKMAPTLDYLRLVFLPWLEAMGAEVRLESLRHGYYPRGGGEVGLAVATGRPLKPLWLEDPGPLREIRGVAHVAHLPMHIPERMAATARAVLADLGPVHIETRVLGDAEAFGQGGALVLFARSEGSRLGASVVAERGVTAEKLGNAAGRTLRAEIAAGGTMDVHAADQLLIYAALCKGASRFTLREVSLHARTAMWLIEQFLPVRFRVASRNGLELVEVVPEG